MLSRNRGIVYEQCRSGIEQHNLRSWSNYEIAKKVNIGLAGRQAGWHDEIDLSRGNVQ
jgi:hypothetical protein